MWAARPHLGSIFEKLLHRKTFWLPAAEKLPPIRFVGNSFDFVLLLFHLINFEQLVLLVQHLFSVLQLPDAFQLA